MKIHVDKQNIVHAVNTVLGVVSTRATLPILSNILLEAKDNILKLNATDLDIGISCEIPVNIVEEGAITVPAKRFSDIVKELPSGEVSINAKKNYQIDIEGVNCRFKLNGLPMEEFPKFPEFKDKEVIQIDQAEFKEVLRLTSFAVSHEESRYVFNGVLMEIDEKEIKVVATDGRRLAMMKNPIVNTIKKEMSVIIPIKAVHELMKNLKDEGVVSIVFGNNQVLFDISGILIATRIIEGEFPNYKQVIPKQIETKAKVETKEVLSAIRRANLLATPDFQAIKFELFNNKMVISKTTPDVGESREEIMMDYTGPELVVGFNPVFLIEFLKNINEENINMEFLGVDKPLVIRISNYLYLALPMRI